MDVGEARPHTTPHDERAIGFARLVQALDRVRADDGANFRVQSVFHRYVVVRRRPRPTPWRARDDDDDDDDVDRLCVAVMTTSNHRDDRTIDDDDAWGRWRG